MMYSELKSKPNFHSENVGIGQPIWNMFKVTNFLKLTVYAFGFDLLIFFDVEKNNPRISLESS